jgi:cysteinyl-tRNA synthetase
VAIGVTLPICGTLNFDYYGAIVGVLAFLITVLMGYQIYTVINVKDELKEMKSLRDSLEQKLNEQKNAITAEYKQEFDYTLPLFVALSKQNMAEIVVNSLNVFARTKTGSWARGFAEQTLVLSILGMDESLFNKIADDVSPRISDKEIVAFYNIIIEKEKAGTFHDADDIRKRLNLLLSKATGLNNGENI